MGRTEMSLVSLLISKLRIHEFPGDRETHPVSHRCDFKAEDNGSGGESARVSKILDTHACRLVEWVVKLCLHSDLSVRVGVDERKPQVGVVSTSKRENKSSVVQSRNRETILQPVRNKYNINLYSRIVNNMIYISFVSC